MNDITGTLIKNYFHCKRQAWLYYYGINFKSNFTKTGQILHKEKNENEIIIDNIKIDNIDYKNKLVIEYKKSSSNLEGSKFQLLYYLYILRQKGLVFKGKLEDLEFKDIYYYELDKENEKKLLCLFYEIKYLLSKNVPVVKLNKRDCKNCSFYDYCWC